MSRKLPEALKSKQEKQKQETISLVENAISTLRELGYEDISISNLMKETNLARSTFAKPHIEEVLQKNEIGKYKNTKKIVVEKIAEQDKQKIVSLEKELNNAKIKIQKLQTSIQLKDMKLKEESMKLYEREIQLNELTAKFQAVYEKLMAMGIEVIL